MLLISYIIISYTFMLVSCNTKRRRNFNNYLEMRVQRGLSRTMWRSFSSLTLAWWPFIWGVIKKNNVISIKFYIFVT
uniref:Uncharacterized protein n=1 Tax=Lutzomyia longipalpis TaxID=7200 RepID=A0A7G3B6A8_LUTLO